MRSATSRGSRRRLDPEAAAELLQCVPPQYQWRGLDRYWRKRAEAAR